MGSLPEVSPSIFTHPLSTPAYKQINSRASNYPLDQPQRSRPRARTARRSSRSPHGGAGKAMPGASMSRTTTPGSSARARSAAQLRATPPTRGHADQGDPGVLRRVLLHLGALTNVDPIAHPNCAPSRTGTPSTGSGARPGSTSAAKVAGNLPCPSGVAHVDALEHQCELGIGPFRKYGKRSSCGIADGRRGR